MGKIVRADQLSVGDVIIESEDKGEETVTDITINEEVSQYNRYQIRTIDEFGNEPIYSCSAGVTYELKEKTSNVEK